MSNRSPKFISIATGLFFLAQTGLAYADCSALNSQKSAVDIGIAQLLLEYPGTNAVIALCMGAAKSEQDKTGSQGSAAAVFATCAAVGCWLADFSNCKTVTFRWFELFQQRSEAERAMREQGCTT